MNKLVSKNPVQRFKDGKKIIKAFNGWQALGQGALNNIPGGKGLNILAGFGAGVYNQAKNVYNSIENLTSNNSSKDNIVKKEGKQKNGYNARWNERNGKFVSGQFMDEDGNVYWYGSDGSKTLIKKRLQNNQSNKLIKQPYFQNQFASRANEIGANKIKEWQNKLGVKVDGVWGQNTENAYQNYLNTQNNFNNINFKSPEIVKPTSNMTYINTNAAANNADYSKQTSGTLKPNAELPAGYSVAYNFVKNNPNLFLKKGGQLVSKNPINRFKQRNFRKVGQ